MIAMQIGSLVTLTSKNWFGVVVSGVKEDTDVMRVFDHSGRMWRVSISDKSTLVLVP